MSPVIFLHGFPVDGSVWSPQLEFLKGKVSAFAPDLRGHGSGPADPGPWMIAHYAEDLKSFVKANKLDRPVLCALSMGGYVALQFAIQYPEMIGGLILCATRADADSNEAKDKRFAAVQKLHSGGFAVWANEFAKAVVSETTAKNNPTLTEEIEKKILANNPNHLAMVLGALASRRDSTPYLSSIKCRTLVVAGAEDKVIPPEVTKTLADQMPAAQFVKIEGAGHFLNLEQPSEFNRIISSWLSS